MRLMLLVSSALVLAISGTSFAQEWTEFSSREDRFTIPFPGQPTVTETTWVSQYSAILPARVYTGTQGSGRYSVTVEQAGFKNYAHVQVAGLGMEKGKTPPTPENIAKVAASGAEKLK